MKVHLDRFGEPVETIEGLVSIDIEPSARTRFWLRDNDIVIFLATNDDAEVFAEGSQHVLHIASREAIQAMRAIRAVSA